MENKKGEKQVFDFLDELPTEFFDDDILLDDTNQDLDKITLQRIKNRTMARINSKRPRFIHRIAAIFVGVILIGGLLVTTGVSANVINVLKYIPGINLIIADPISDNYLVINHPIKVQNGYQEIELVSVTVNKDLGFININARGNGNKITKVSIKLPDGTTIPLTTYSVASGSDTWTGNYSTQIDLIKDMEIQENVTVSILFGEDANTQISAKLVKAPAVEVIVQLGPTIKQNDLSITAIPQLRNNALTINLLTPNNSLIHQFAADPSWNNIATENQVIKLVDEQGNVIIGNGRSSFSPPLAEFTFDIDEAYMGLYTLLIPHVNMNYPINEVFDLEIPKLGEFKVYDDYLINIGDYQFEVLKITRINEHEIKIDVDMLYDKEANESLYFLQVGAYTKKHLFSSKSQYSSFSQMVNQASGALESIIITLDNPNAKTLPLYIRSINTVKKGPWEIPIDSSSFNR